MTKKTELTSELPKRESNASSGRVLSMMLNASEEHWGKIVADKVIEIFPNQEVYTCAAGISPSGIVHFGNFRDVMTSYAVLKALQSKGKKVRFLFSWDNYDRFRKVPEGIDISYRQYIGMPLSSVPDPTGEYSSYAERFQTEFEQAMKELNIELEYRSQTHEYQSGRYDQQIFSCLQRRDEIAQILLSFMSEKAKAEKQIDENEYRRTYYPISLYSRFTNKDSTEILEYDGGTKVTYKCLETGKIETVDLSIDRIAKLAWKIDWPMRWEQEGVIFEPGGHDHASPGGSYDTSSIISKKIFNREGPIFVGYEFIGIQGFDGKMSGSKGNAISPATLLDVYEPQLLKWLYLRKEPNQKFQLAFDSEINRQYEEFDRETVDCTAGKLGSSRKTALELSFQDTKTTIPEKPMPFKQAIALGQIVQWDFEKVLELLKGMEIEYSKESIKVRLLKARAWLETYNPDQIIKLCPEINKEYIALMSPVAVENVRKLRQALLENDKSIHDLELIVYGIPKDPALTDKENSPMQRAFFKDVYNLLINSDVGPRLATFLWAIDRKKVLGLLDI